MQKVAQPMLDVGQDMLELLPQIFRNWGLRQGVG